MKKSITFLEKCLEALKKSKGGKIVIDDYETHHVLILKDGKIEDHIVCTTKQAKRLIPFADEKVLIPTRGFEYHFYNKIHDEKDH